MVKKKPQEKTFLKALHLALFFFFLLSSSFYSAGDQSWVLSHDMPGQQHPLLSLRPVAFSY
jgi:hypothetical protein